MLALLAIQSAPKITNSKQHLFLFLSAISVGALFIGLTPKYLNIPKALYVSARMIDIPHLVFVWLFSLSLFQNDFRVRTQHWVLGLIYCGPIFCVRLAQFGVFNKLEFWWIGLANIFTILLMIHLVYSVSIERRDDLSKPRRNSRIYFVLAIASVAVLTAASEAFVIGANHDHIGTIKTLTILPGVAWIAIWLLTLNSSRLNFDQTIMANPEVLDYRDILLRESLNKEMFERRAYLQADLTIKSLASRLGVSQDRLRELINQRLGFKNFSSYLNQHRIEAVKVAMKDHRNAHRPILNLALEHGFASLSPFNRAFLKIEGVTPSQYRTTIKNEKK